MNVSSFRSMGTDVSMITPLEPRSHDDLTREVIALFLAAERCFSRFVDDSELSRLNRSRGSVEVSPMLFEALSVAHRHVVASHGAFDPAVGGDLITAGYDRPFSPGALDRSASVHASDRHPTFSEVVLDSASHTVLLPPGVQIDLGGFAKGWTADIVSRTLPENSVIDAGGDAVLRGTGEDGEGWRVDVEDPFDPDHIVASLRVSECAVATSGITRRRWVAGGHEQHHLIDPHTRLPSRSDIAQVTVIAPSAQEAEVIAKTTLLLGSNEGMRWLRAQPNIRGLAVLRDRSIQTTGDLSS
jgi:thiamine biosynthesis lipoprotein